MSFMDLLASALGNVPSFADDDTLGRPIVRESREGNPDE
jgi:hypothetical protein